MLSPGTSSGGGGGGDAGVCYQAWGKNKEIELCPSQLLEWQLYNCVTGYLGLVENYAMFVCLSYCL